MAEIRPAEVRDISRIAEILIFTKRMNYREIFHDDQVSFGEMQVLPLAQEYLEHPEKLDGIWVYDDGFVKGLVHINPPEASDLYVEHFFQGQGIGGALLRFAIENFDVRELWVLEKNPKARALYERLGFVPTGERKLEPGTPEYILKMERNVSDTQ